MPKVSVIIPVYNTEKYIEQCLNSISGQTLKDIEIIAVDDESTDNSLVLMRECAKKDPRIKVLTQKNARTGAARNKGLDNATGKYIAFVDSDDYLAPDALEAYYNAAENNNADLVINPPVNFADEAQSKSDSSFAAFCKTKINQFKDEADPQGLYPFKGNVRHYNVIPGGKLYKKEIIDKYNIRNPENINHEDESWAWYYLVRIKTVYCLGGDYYLRRLHTNSIMGQVLFAGKNQTNVLAHLEYVYKFLTENNLYLQYSREYKNFADALGNFLVHNGASHEEVAASVNEIIKRNNIKLYNSGSFLEKIFSVKNRTLFGYRKKILTFLGIKIVLSNKPDKDTRLYLERAKQLQK